MDPIYFGFGLRIMLNKSYSSPNHYSARVRCAMYQRADAWHKKSGDKGQAWRVNSGKSRRVAQAEVRTER
jgi:hypothetical protein